MTDKLNITIRIAELKPFALEIDRADEAEIREAEYNVNKLWRNWSARFSDKSSHEVLGMVAFQFAKAFLVQNKRVETSAEIINKIDAELDNLLNEMSDPPVR